MEKKEIRWCRLDRKEALKKLPFTISNLVNKYNFKYDPGYIRLVWDIDAYLENAMSNSGYIKHFHDASRLYWVVFTKKFIKVYYTPRTDMGGTDANSRQKYKRLYEKIYKAIEDGKEEE